MKRRMITAVCMGMAVMAAVPAMNTFASTSHYADSSTLSSDSSWTDWVQKWNSVAADDTKVSIAPGADETQLNFAWYSKVESGNPQLQWRQVSAFDLPGPAGARDGVLARELAQFARDRKSVV